MGEAWSKMCEGPYEKELKELKTCLSTLLRQLSPADLLLYALEDKEVHEVCEENEDLRQSCIIAAVRKYHTEKYFFEEVHNRTADYVKLLDHFVQIQDELELKRMRKRKIFPIFRRRDKRTKVKHVKEEIRKIVESDDDDDDAE